MMTYTDCPTCEDNKHGLHTCELPNEIICTCPICNALAIHDAISINDEHHLNMSKEALIGNIDNFKWHIEKMTDSEYAIFHNEMKKQ